MTKLFMRMENDSSAAIAANPQESLAIDSNARVDAEAVTEAAADVTSVDTGIENALEAESEVAGATATMEEAVAEGDGLSPREAEMVEARLERAARLVGADLGSMGLTFRRESFGGRESRLAVTKMRLEAAEGFGARIWESIKKAWQWLMDAAKNLFNKLTKSAESQVERFKALKARASDIKGEKKESKMKAAVATFSIGGVTSLETIKKMAEMTKSYSALYASVSERMTMTNKDTQNVSPSEAAKSVLKAAFPTEEAISVADLKKDGEVAYGRFPGGRSIILTKSKIGNASVNKFAISKIDEKLAEDYASFDKGELDTLIATGTGLANELKSFKNNQSKMEKTISTNMKYVEDMMANAHTSTENDDKSAKDSNTEKLENFRAYMTSAQSLVKLMTSEVPTSFFNIVSGIGDVVQAGIGNFKEKS